MADEKYNFIYRKLVEDDDDLLGIIAYSLYKRQKFEFIENFKRKHGKEPEPKDFESFNDLTSGELQLKSYFNEAQTLAQKFLDESLEADGAELEKKYSKMAEETIRKAKPSFWFGVWQSVVASFIFVILIGVLVFFTWSLKQGFRQALENTFDVKITDAPLSPAVAQPPAPPH